MQWSDFCKLSGEQQSFLIAVYESEQQISAVLMEQVNAKNTMNSGQSNQQG